MTVLFLTIECNCLKSYSYVFINARFLSNYKKFFLVYFLGYWWGLMLSV